MFVAIALSPGETVRIIAIATAHENAAGAPSFVPLAEAAVAYGALRPGTTFWRTRRTRRAK